jgi:hypothetical protein
VKNEVARQQFSQQHSNTQLNKRERMEEEQQQAKSWTDDERRALSTHIEEGYLQAERGELVDRQGRPHTRCCTA